MKKLVIVDLSSFIFRAYFAITPLKSPEGIVVNALYGVASMIFKLLEDVSPNYVAIALDTKEKNFRHELEPNYKANRSSPPEDLIPQFALIEELLRIMNLKLLRLGGLEADDLIASLVKKFSSEVEEIVIISSDKDLMQLVSSNVLILDTMKGLYYGEKEVKEKLGIFPCAVADYLSLVGDTSDNIAGVAGVGPKTAIKILEEYKNLENVLGVLREYSESPALIPSLLKKLVGQEEKILLARQLTQLKIISLDFELEELSFRFEFSSSLKKFFERFQFKQFLKKFSSYEKQEEKQEEEKQEEKESYMLVSAEEMLSFDFSQGIACFLEEDHFFFCLRNQENIQYFSISENEESWKKILLKLGTKESHVICWDARLWFQLAFKYQFSFEAICDDLCLMNYLLSPGNFSSKREDSKKTLPEWFQEAISLQDKLKEEQMLDVYERIDFPTLKLLVEMESEGITIEKSILQNLAILVSEKLQSLEKTLKEFSEKSDFNIRSPKQLALILFTQMRLPILKSNKTGPSTDASTLEALLELENLSSFGPQAKEILEKLLEFRELDKLLSTYILPLQEKISLETGKIHTQFTLTVTSTGRLSSLNPNLQNIPIKTPLGREIRKAFVASKGNIFVAADYSQIELRLLAHFSQDPVLCEAFLEEKDIHAQTAAEVLGISLEEVSSEQRNWAKAVNFGLMYGQTSFGLAKTLKIPQSKAQEYIKRYFLRFSKVKVFLDSLKEECLQKGYAITLWGRRRPIPEIFSQNTVTKSLGERLAVNSPIQGTAADLIKIAALSLSSHREIKDLQGKILLQIHDELIMECPEQNAAQCLSVMSKVMESVCSLHVPLKVSCSMGKNWFDLK